MTETIPFTFKNCPFVSIASLHLVCHVEVRMLEPPSLCPTTCNDVGLLKSILNIQVRL